jgi:hypothetical protein
MARGDFTVNEDLHPRFRDTDAMGHINNAVYVTYLEVARQAYWARLTGGSDYRLVPFILAHVRCDFDSGLLRLRGQDHDPDAGRAAPQDGGVRGATTESRDNR